METTPNKTKKHSGNTAALRDRIACAIEADFAVIESDAEIVGARMDVVAAAIAERRAYLDTPAGRTYAVEATLFRRLIVTTTVAEVDAIEAEARAAGVRTSFLDSQIADRRYRLAPPKRRWVDDPYRERTQAAGVDPFGHWEAA